MEGLLALEIDQDLLATCSALGYTEGDQYYKGDECWECMKDLIRFLRLDAPETCTVRRQLGRMQTVQKDLLPILVNFHEDEKLLDASIKLLINLTQPALLCMEGKYNLKDVQGNRVYLELNQYLQDYKQSFTNEKVMYVLGTWLAQLCNQPAEDRSPDDSLMVERILILLRNILHIPSSPEQEKRTDDDVDLHDEIIWNFHINGIDDLLIYICNSSNESQWMMHGLEIIFLMMREQSAARLAAAKTQAVREAEDMDFELLIERERQQRKMKSRNCSTRHSRFGGTYVMVGTTALNDSENVLYHKPLSKVKSHSLDSTKRRYKVPKRRAPAVPCAKPRQTTLSVRLMLQKFSVNFLEYCYNTMMRAARDLITRHHHLDHDETYYLWAVRFFMEFNRLHHFQVDLVSETLTMAVSLFIMTHLMTYCEKTMDYKGLEARPWSRRLHYALKACREVLQYIQTMAVHSDPGMRDNADIMQSNLFYTQDFREIFPTLLRNYEEVKSDKDYLCDLVETTHLFLKLLEHYCKKKSNVLVQHKRRQGKGRRKKRRQNSKRVQLNELELDSMWMEMEPKVVDLLQPEAELPESPDPFDGASGIDMEEQKYITLDKVVELLHNQQQGEAVALLRSARTVWPDSVFGSAGLTTDDEHKLLKDTFMAKPFIQTNNGEQEEDDDDEETGGADQEDEEQPTVTKYEMQFDVEKYASRFAHGKIVHAYCLLLQKYRQNSSHTNHCIIKMLHRVSIHCRMAPMLYHISVFKTLDEILNDPAASKMDEMVQFAKYIVAGFFKMAAGNPCMFAELLFWKGSIDVCELQEGYGAVERRRALKHMKSLWTFEQEEQLTDLYYKHKGSSDLLGEIINDLPHEPERSRRQISAKLLALGLVTDRKELHKRKSKRKVGTRRSPKAGTSWSEKEVEKLQDLFFEFSVKDGLAPLKEIADRLQTKPIEEIAKKLQEIGLMDPVDPELETDGLPSTDDELKKSSSSDESDGDDGNDKMRPTVRHQRVQREPQMSRANCAQLVQQLHENGFSAALEWLAESLGDEADDRSPGDVWEHLPIVPIREDARQAVKEPVFVQLLKNLGLTPPQADQDCFWRIPRDMTPNELRQAVRIVTTNANHPSTLNEVNETTRPTLSGSPGEMSRQGLTASVENEMALEEGLRIGRNREVCVADFASETVGFENSCQSNQTRETKRKRIVCLSDDDSTEETAHQSPQTNTESNSLVSKKTRYLIRDSSDDEIEGHREQQDQANVVVDLQDSSSDSDTEQPKKLVIVESDSEH